MEQLDVLKGQLSRYGDIKAPKMADFTLEEENEQINK